MTAETVLYQQPAMAQMPMPKRPNVKSGNEDAADAHERGRDYLGPAQIDRLLAAARKGRHGVRDHLLMLMMFRHGLRVSEAIALRRAHVDLERSRLWVARLKGGLSVEHPIGGDELRAIRRWLAQRDNALPWLFISERNQPMTRQSVSYLIGSTALRAGIGRINPHMLRHSCGFALANRGYDSTVNPRLSRPPRSSAHRALHTHSSAAVRWHMVSGSRLRER